MTLYINDIYTGHQGNCGCEGGLVDQAFEYIIKNKGIDCELFYPYMARVSYWISLRMTRHFKSLVVGQDWICHYIGIFRAATMSNYKFLTSGNETDLQIAVATVGPISVAVDASKPTFQVMYMQ